MHPKVSVVILNYNGARWLPACLDAVLATTYANFFVIVVDNASTDDSLNLLRSSYPQVTLITETENHGFSAGNNSGIQAALEQGADYVVLLNPDTKVKPGWLAALIAVGEQQSTVGILGAVQLRYDGEEWNAWTTKALTSEQQDWLIQGKPWLEVEWVEGACFAIKRGVLQTVGLFDPIYFSFYEELDYCRRARYHGYRTALVTGCLVHHHRGGIWQTDAQRHTARDYQCDKSQFIYSLTAPDKTLAANLSNYFVTYVVKCKESLLSFRYSRLITLTWMQFSVWRKGRAIWRKWRADRNKLPVYGFR